MLRKLLVIALAAIMLVGVVCAATASRNGHEINYVQREERSAEQEQRALEQIQAAEEMIAQADSLIDSLTCEPPHAAVVLLDQAKEHLANAREAFDEGKYGPAYGLANAAEMLARNAVRMLEDMYKEDEVEENENEEEVEEEGEEEGKAEDVEVEDEEEAEEDEEETEEEEGEQLPAGESEETLQQLGKIDDITPPVVHEVWVSPSVIGPEGGTFTVYMRVTDDLSGIDWVGAGACSPSSYHCADFVADGVTPDGVYFETLYIPKYAESGIWRVYVEAWDVVGNDRYIAEAATVELDP
ncbi:MAG: hypothetical protein QMD00_02650 [Hadesarchaea archaeon]|nr:hypothetical protein [Hadesarchaea archaeon]